jgi:hypothetical protein
MFKTTTFILAVVAILSNNIFAQDTKEVRELMCKKIKASGISSITVTKYDYKFGKPEKEGTKVKYSEYNDDGYISSEIIYKYEEDEYTKIEYKYKKSAHEIDIKTYDADNNIKKKVVQKCNSADDITEEIEYVSSGDLKSKIIYDYKTSGQLSTQTKFDKNGNMIKFTEYNYNANNNLIEKTTKSDSIHIIDKFTYKYDDSNNKVEEVKYTSEGKVKEKYVYKYEGLNRIEEIKYNTDENMGYKVINKYDGSGNKIKRVLYSSDGQTIALQVNYKYDKNGNLQEEVESNKLGEKTKLTVYEF